jgi:aconitate hydratase
MFASRYGDVFKGDKNWQGIKITGGQTYAWEGDSTYVQNPPYFPNMSMTPTPVTDIVEARVLAVFGDSITTDHISPAGSIKTSPAGQYLVDNGVQPHGLQRLRRASRQPPGHDARHLRQHPHPQQDHPGHRRRRDQALPVGRSDVDLRRGHEVPGRRSSGSVVFAGKEYGTGSSRDWAAKGTKLLGVRAVICESFERIHRSNLVGMGVLPLQFVQDGWQKLELTGEEIVSIRGLQDLSPRKQLIVELYRPSDGRIARFPVRCRIDTPTELEYFKNGGVLNYVLRNLAKAD